MFQLQQRASASTKLRDHPGSDFSPEVLQIRLNAFPGHLLKLAPVITWPLLVSQKKGNKNSLTAKILRLKNMLMAKVCSELARGFVRKSTNDKACSELVRLFGVCSELARSSFGVRSEFVRSLFGVRSEFVRSLFVRSSEFAWSLFGVCSELVHEEPGASEKRLPRKTRSAPYYVVCGQNPKNVPMQDLLQITAFFVKTRNCRKRKPNLPKYEQNLGSNTTHFAAYRRGKLFRKTVQALSSWRPRLISV